jgi:hypothetical protein
MNSLTVLAKGLAWAVAIGFVAFFVGYYGVASGFLGFWTLGVLAVASVGIICLFRDCTKGVATVNCEMCLLAIWFGHLTGTMAIGGGCDGEWFCIGFFWPWLFFAVVGGIAARVSARGTDLPSRRTTRIATGSLLGAAALVGCGFAQLYFCHEQPIATFRAVWFFLQEISFSPDGKILATVGGIAEWDKNVRLWNADTGRTQGQCDKERANNGMEKAAVQCCGDPPLVAASSYLPDFLHSDSKIVIQVWDSATQKLKQRLQWDDSIGVRHSQFSRDGRWFVYANFNGNLRAFDLQAGRIAVDLKRQKDNYVRCLAISPSREQLACANYNKEIEIWNVASAKLMRRISAAQQPSCIDFSPDGRSLAYGTDNGVVEQIEIGEEKTIHTLECFAGRNGVDAIKFSPNGALLGCAGGDDGITEVIDTKRWSVVASLRTWGGWRTECLAFSSDGRRLATGDANGRVAIWDTAGWRGK